MAEWRMPGRVVLSHCLSILAPTYFWGWGSVDEIRVAEVLNFRILWAGTKEHPSKFIGHGKEPQMTWAPVQDYTELGSRTRDLASQEE